MFIYDLAALVMFINSEEVVSNISVTQEMSASTGFKNIHEYLQEANLYSESKN